MKWFLLIAALLVALCPMYAVAGEPEAITVWKLDAGYYVVSGSQIVAFPPSGPVVPPVDPVVPPTPSGKAAAIKAAVEAVDTDPQKVTTTSNLAAMMGMLKSQIEAGTIKDYQTISASTNWLWDQLTAGRAAAWQPVKTLIGNHLAALAQEGAQPEEYAGYFADAEQALNGTLSAEELLQAEDDPLGIDIDRLMKLFEFFVTYILPLIIKII